MVKCDICESVINNEIFVIAKVPEYTFEFSDRTLDLTIIECQNCGAVQLVNVPLSDTWQENNRSIGSTKDYREKKKQELKKFIEKYNLQNKKFLEIGCGDGQYLDIFRELGIECDGTEVSNKNINKCREKNFKVYGNFSPKYGYNIICCFYFLEHQSTPNIFIQKTYNTLTPDGLLYFEVPNYDYIEKNNLWLEFTRDHRFYYRKRTLMYLLINQGFEVLETDNNTICLSVVARKPRIINFDNMKNKMQEDIERFNILTQNLSNYAIAGAGHYTQLLLNHIKNKPKYIYDSVPAKVGNKLCGIEIQHQNEIVKCDCNDIIISCGMYNQEAYNNIKKLVPEKNLIIWE